MIAGRIIPCLLWRGAGLVKTVRYRNPTYVGDPINAVRIFSDKEADELFLVDIDATRKGYEPRFAEIEDIVSEAFMPIGYCGGVRSVDHARRLVRLGVEKVAVNSGALERPGLITEIAAEIGSSSTVGVIDVKKPLFGRPAVWSHAGRKVALADPVAYAVELQRLGAGEILLSAVDRDGMMQGYDLDLVGRIAKAVDVPVVALGGAGSVQDLRSALSSGAAGAAAGSLFVFHGTHKAVLISFPSRREFASLRAPTG
ncbi:MAG: AglZ/HisF2 family acetamidino modification protein [Enhydrobacter sp.]|nr:MAG: AglZ/HisF2 family acetamidino modification protein [Enhydrobacter sp.]